MASSKWTPAVPARRPDMIISSKARENNEMGFRPTYENDRDNMNFIMSNEYTRLWLRERAEYEVDTYSKLEVEGTNKDIRRRYVQRMMKPRKGSVRVMPIITLKRFAKPPKKEKVETKGEEKVEELKEEVEEEKE